MTTTEPPIRARMSLVGLDGNAFAIIGAVARGLRMAGATVEQVEAFRVEATAGDYDQVLRAALRWTVEPDEGDDE